MLGSGGQVFQAWQLEHGYVCILLLRTRCFLSATVYDVYKATLEPTGTSEVLAVERSQISPAGLLHHL